MVSFMRRFEGLFDKRFQWLSFLISEPQTTRASSFIIETPRTTLYSVTGTFLVSALKDVVFMTVQTFYVRSITWKVLLVLI